jgi:hypothetical protein
MNDELMTLLGIVMLTKSGSPKADKNSKGGIIRVNNLA